MSRLFTAILTLFLVINSFAQNEIITAAKKYVSEDLDKMLIVSVKNQQLYYIKQNKMIDKYFIKASIIS